MENSTPLPVRVFVVEDNLDDQELLAHQLRKTPLGEHILFFSDPRLALDKLRAPDSACLRETLVALFIDIHLPSMSGVDLLRHVRKIEGLHDIPVIVMTTNPHPDTIKACKELNVAFIAEKPVTLSQFAKVLADLFHQNQPVAT